MYCEPAPAIGSASFCVFSLHILGHFRLEPRSVGCGRLFQVLKVASMNREEIEQAIKDAGWELDGGFSEHLLIGNDSTVSILAYRWVWGSDDPVFELYDEERGLTYWVREIPSPRQAAVLLEERGGRPEEERGNPYKQDE